jgi:hypothetical protein
MGKDMRGRVVRRLLQAAETAQAADAKARKKTQARAPRYRIEPHELYCLAFAAARHCLGLRAPDGSCPKCAAATEAKHFCRACQRVHEVQGACPTTTTGSEAGSPAGER